MSTKLPDMCAYEVLDILQSVFKLPVVMILDPYNESSMLKYLQNGAIYCLVKPLFLENVDNLWQHCIVHETHLIREFYASSKSGITDDESVNNEAKELNRVEGSSTELSSSFTWTPYLQSKLIRVIYELGFYDADPSEVICRMGMPWLSTELVSEKLEEYGLYLERQELELERVNIAHNQLVGQTMYTSSGQAFSRYTFSGLLQNPQDQDQDQMNRTQVQVGREVQASSSTLLSSPLFPNTSQLPAPVPLENTAQRFNQQPGSCTVTGVPSVTMAPPEPGQRDDEKEHGEHFPSGQFFH